MNRIVPLVIAALAIAVPVATAAPAQKEASPSIATLERFVSAQGREPIGPHTEVYLTDPADTPEDRMRTLLRQPVRW